MIHVVYHTGEGPLGGPHPWIDIREGTSLMALTYAKFRELLERGQELIDRTEQTRGG